MASIPDSSDVSADAVGDEFVISLTTYRITAADEAMVAAHNPRTVFDSIPREVTHDGASFTVTAIGDGAFQGDTIRELVLPYTVESIGDHAFQGCVNLESIDLPSSLQAIGASAFQGCVKLKTVALPSAITSVGEDAFKGCSGIEAMDFSDVPTSVDLSGAFPFAFAAEPGYMSGKMFKRNAGGTFEEKTLYKLTINTFGTAELYGYFAEGEPIPSDATAEPSRSGSSFFGWVCEGAAPPTAMPAHDVEIDAIWAVIEYEFTFWTGG